MSYPIVQAELDARASAYWISSYGRDTAARFPTRPFWALRGHLSRESEGDEDQPSSLFVLSRSPSPVPFPEASLTVGPKRDWKTEKYSYTDADLLIRPFFPTYEEALNSPIYLHTTPRLRCNWRSTSRPKSVQLRLAKESRHDFVDAAHEAMHMAQTLCTQGRRVYQRAIPGQKALSTTRVASNTDLTYLFGELHDPKSYVFKFSPADKLVHPELLEPVTIYEEVLLYQQVCIDYRWRYVDATIQWVCAMRKLRPSTSRTSATDCTHIKTNISILSAAYQQNAKAVHDMEAVFSMSYELSEPHLPFSFPFLPWEYPQIPLGRPKVVAFDLFGTLLNREDAIRKAINPWASGARRGQPPPDLTPLYVRIEAEVAYECRTRSASLAEIVRAALWRLVQELGVQDNQQSTCIAKAAHIILTPSLYPDVVPTLVNLIQHHYTLVCIPTYSDTTMHHMQSIFPKHCLEKMHVCPAFVSPHFASAPRIFDALLSTCKHVVPGGVKAPEILVVTTGIGRLLAPALARGHPTALIRRAGNLEANVNFYLGEGPETPVPSLTTKSLIGLCRKLWLVSCLASNESLSGSLPNNPPPTRNTRVGPSSTMAAGDSKATIRQEEDRIAYSWSFSICGTYQVTRCLGNGARSWVFAAFHTLTGQSVAAKIEQLLVDPLRPPFLEYEIAIYKLLRGAPPGIPTIHWSGRDGSYAVLIMDQLGPSLKALHKFCRGKFSSRTICQLADQMLSRLEFVHSRGVVMCDVQPNNFATGLDTSANTLHLIDFSHSALYIDPKTGKHIPSTNRRLAIGTVRYASIAAHRRQAVSRRDDLESLLYVLIDLYTGALPWKDINQSTEEDVKDQERRIRECKEGAPLHDLLAILPPEFQHYHSECASLAFGQTPDYDYLRNLFHVRMSVQGWEADAEYDWISTDRKALPHGTLIPEEYVFSLRFVHESVDLEP